MAAAASNTLEALAERAIPNLADLFNASVVEYFLLCRDGGMRGFSAPGAQELTSSYSQEFLADDPLHQVKLERPAPVMIPTRLVTRKAWTSSTVYAHVYRPARIEHLLVAHFTAADQHGDGIGVAIGRSRAAGDFTSASTLLMKKLFPALAVASQRLKVNHAATEHALGLCALLEQSQQRAAVVLYDRHAARVWQSSLAGRYDELIAAIDARHPVGIAMRQLSRGGLGDSFDLPAAQLRHMCFIDGQAVLATLQLLSSSEGQFVAVTFNDAVEGASFGHWMHVFGLTRMECTVLAELTQGLSNSEIARKLFISPSTVRTHLEHIFRKLRVSSRLQAVVKAQSSIFPEKRLT